MSDKTLVLALGNPLRGDDGAGAAIIENLETIDLPENIVLMDGGTPGLETVLLMQGYDRVIVIDAAEMQLPPGTWRQFTPDMVRLQSRDMYLRGTLHYAGLAEALALGEAMGLLPSEIIIFGIQPQEVGWEIGLTPPVQAAIPAVSMAITEVLHGENTCC